MKSVVRRLFALNPGEENKIFLLSLLGFMWALGSTIALKYSDAAFLTHVGAEQLHAVYKMVSCGLILLSFVLLRLFSVQSKYRIFLQVLTTGVLFYSGIYTFLFFADPAESVWIWYALRIFGYLFFTVLLTCYWTFIDQYLHTGDAKRLFGIFSSTIFLGTAMAGLVMHFGILNLSTLFPFVIASFLLTSLLVHKIQYKLSISDPSDQYSGTDIKESHSIGNLVKTILSSRYTLLMIVGNFLTFLLWVITEYNYMSTFNEKFTSPSQEMELTRFLGKCVTIVAITNLLFGFFIYGRLVKRFGVGTVMLYSPVLFLVTFTGWLINSSIIFPMMGFFIVEGSLFIIDDSNFSLLLKSGPSFVKSKLRILIEAFFEPAGMLASGMILSIPQINSKLLGLGLACCLVVVAFTMKTLYFSSKAKKAQLEI